MTAQHAYTMPDVAPLYPQLPYVYRDYLRLSVYCRTSSEVLAGLLPKPLELADDRFEVFFLDAPQVSGLRPYAECGIVVPCAYQGISGAHVAFEYVTTDDALCVGREVWGYPKKLASVHTALQEKRATGSCSRAGHALMSAAFQAAAEVSVEAPQLHPRLQVRRLPEANGTRRDQVVRNDLGEASTASNAPGTATVTFGGELAPLDGCEILSAVLTRGDFTLDYGRVVGQV